MFFVLIYLQKDKASILSSTTKYLTSLKSHAEELEERNKQLESKLNKPKRAQSQEGAGTSSAVQQQGSTTTEGSDNMVTVEVSKIRGSSNAFDEMGIVAVIDRLTNMIDLMIVMLTRPCQR